MLVMMDVMLSMVVVVMHGGMAWITLSVIALLVRVLLKEVLDIVPKVLGAVHDGISDALYPVFDVISGVFQIVSEMVEHSLVWVMPIISAILLPLVLVVHVV
jgi:hypothetical protein